jgi:hypothetical protein
MTKELISKATRNAFREFLVITSLREIKLIFDGVGLAPRTDFTPNVSGQRRSLVEQYYANVDFCSLSDVKKVVSAYDEVMEKIQNSIDMGAGPNAPVKAALIRRMYRDGFTYVDSHFHIDQTSIGAGIVPVLSLTGESLLEHVEKAKAKIEAGDNAGAITSAYTLVEAFLKAILAKGDILFNRDEGDIRKLYKLASGPLHLNPDGEQLESYLKSILQGLKGQLSGLYELANKASDRHARRYNPAKHHAKLAVNAAFTLCEFLLDSFEYQEARKKVSK